MAPTFSFDKKTNRYRYTSGDRNGQFVSATKVNALVESYIEQQKAEVKVVTQLMLEKVAPVSAWLRSVAQSIKAMHINAYAIGRGGVGQLTARDYGVIGARLRREYGYLRQFSLEILKGNLSEAQINNRVNNYLGALHSVSETGKIEAARANGIQWERRIKTAAESCQGCIEEANKGWQPLGRLAAIGTQECRMNCRCYKEFSSEGDRPSNNSILTQKLGWLK